MTGRPDRSVDDEASRAALAGGGLPIEARRRLAQEAGEHPVFASDLSADEFLLARSLGYEAAGLVIGSSIYHVGWQYRGTYWRGGRELEVISRAHQHARELAMGRMQQEAAALGAHGVIGVRLAVKEKEWGADLLEFTAIGTAVRMRGAAPPQHPFLSDLSGEDFWTLLQAGYAPRGLAMGYCAYFVYGSQALSSWRSAYRNQEVTEFTQGVYQARSIAMHRLEADVRRLDAAGVVGVKVETDKRVYHESDSDPLHLQVSFLAVGTAVVGWQERPAVAAPRPVLNLTGLRPVRQMLDDAELQRD